MKRASLFFIIIAGGALLGGQVGAQVNAQVNAQSAQEELNTLAVGNEAQLDLHVTVYNNNYGLVREIRSITLPQGLIELEFQDVAEQIDPTSVAFKSLTSPEGVGILEQNYRYDLLSPQTLLEKFVGRTVRYTTVRMENNTQIESSREGILLSTNNGIIVRFGDEIVINPPGSVSLGEVPEDLLSRPTLLWLLQSDEAGEHRIETSYLTNGMSWKADYVTVINSDDTELDLTGWVTLNNRSGATYRNAALKLVAGDVQRVRDQIPRRGRAPTLTMAEARAPQFAEQSFFEYHLYTLQRRTTLANNETKQMTLLEGSGIPVKKTYVIDSPPWALQAGIKGAEKRSVSVMIEFENTEDAGLGIALPGGRVRVYKADADGSLQLVGEDRIGHTPRDEKVRLKLGEAFDIVAERAQTDFRRVSSRVSDLSYRVTLRNHKDESITAIVIEHIYGDWTITRQSHPHYKRDSRTLEFTIPVPARGETVLTYTGRVRY